MALPAEDRTHPPPAPEQIQMLTGAAPPAETTADQTARSAAVISRADSLTATTLHAETSSPQIPTLTLRASCSGAACTVSEPTIGYSITVRLSNLEFVSVNSQPVGTKHGVTLIRWEGTNDGVDLSALGAWMQHSAFGVQTERSTVEDIQVNGRYGIAAGDLTGAPPAGSATWQGLMVGTPATGAGRGDRLQGDASLKYDMGTQELDAAFTNIQNIDRLGAHSVSAVRFNDVSVNSDGTFKAGLTGNRIQGGFFGSSHAEATGVFEQQNIVGAFGTRQ